MDPAIDLRVLRARLQVLADRDDVDVVLAQIAHRLHDLVVRLPQPDDDPGLRHQRVGWVLGLAGMDVAVAAGARAGVAKDLERGRATPPALGDVRATGLLADRVQRLSVDQLLDVEVARIRARRAHLHPFGPPRPLGYRERLLHAAESNRSLERGRSSIPK